MAYWLFWIKVTQETADSREALRPSSLSPWHQEIKLPLKGVLPVPAGRKMSLSSETGIEGQEACINKSCYFFSNLPSKPKLCLNSLLITHPHLISLFFRVLSTFLYLHLKSIKPVYFGHFLVSTSVRPHHTRMNLFLVLSLICLVSILLLVQP